MKEWPHKARNVQFYVWLLSFEPGPNPARTQTPSVLPGLAPSLRPGQGLGLRRLLLCGGRINIAPSERMEDFGTVERIFLIWYWRDLLKYVNTLQFC
jgi:hypothetical protein